MRASTLSAAFAAFIALLAACSSSTTTNPTSPVDDAGANAETSSPLATVSPEEFCEKTVGYLKRHLANCCNAKDRATQEYSITAQAYARVVEDCTAAAAASLDNAHARVDAEGAKQCMDAYAPYLGKIQCWDGLFAVGNDVVGKCDSVFIGLQNEGDACARDFECVEVFWCSQAKRVCVPPAATGASCASTSSGQSSLTHARCVDGNYCTADTKKCALLKKAGTSCVAANECTTGHCYLGKCADIGPAAVGKPCDVRSDCGRGDYCKKADPSARGTCATRLVEGDVCSPDAEACRGLCKANDAGAASCVSWCSTG